MFWALVRKDARLLQVYLVYGAGTTIIAYLVTGFIAVTLSQYQQSSAINLARLSLMTLSGGSNFGFVATSFFAALLAGSVFTLERSDRSAEFLACLPPTRAQNLQSKLFVVLGAVVAMIAVHLFTNWIAHALVPHVRASGAFAANNVVDARGLMMLISVIVSIVGGAFLASAWLDSNGVPILVGLLTPLLSLSVVSSIGWMLDVSTDSDTFVDRYTTASIVLGATFAYIGSYWYLIRNQP